MALITCPVCGQNIPEESVVCPYCGQPLQLFQGNQYGPNYYGNNNYGLQPMPKKNDKTTLVILLALVALALLMALLFGMKGCKSDAPVPTPVDTVTVVDTVIVTDTVQVNIKDKEEEITPAPRPHRHQEYIPDELTEYVVVSETGNGVYLRTQPREGAKTDIILEDGTVFYGAYCSVPGWLMIVDGDQIVGYIHERKVMPSETDYEGYDEENEDDSYDYYQ